MDIRKMLSELPKFPTFEFKDSEFGKVQFAKDFPDHIKAYVWLKVKGMRPNGAFLAVFGHQYRDDHLQLRVWNLECNPYVVNELLTILSSINPKDMWDLQLSVYNLRQVATDPDERGTARIAANRELNMLMGIVMIDDKGNARKTDMSDFYKDVAQSKAEVAAQTENSASDQPESTGILG